MPEDITAKFRIVTPMFVSGLDPKVPELRPPSIKGALRFWWRALEWGRCLRQAGDQTVAGLRLLHRLEAELFGSASGAGIDARGNSRRREGSRGAGISRVLGSHE